MDKLVLCLAGYAILMTAGWRAIKDQGRKLELALFVIIVACCLYMSLAKLYRWPMFSVITLHDRVFYMLGHWIMRMLGTEA
ncbi:hypothetical protein [Cohnella panacarvi]|uniref:hypothetical protein n=1 Tax=Cohnella panacarvi TaxID=400776 RepID=UPI0004792DDA|nr:hypothetical protein [Cohnella panacarvi]